MADRPIHYEPHPVSKERKAELIAQGFSIVDAKFKPKDAPVMATTMPPDGMEFTQSSMAVVAPIVKPRGKPGRKPKA